MSFINGLRQLSDRLEQIDAHEERLDETEQRVEDLEETIAGPIVDEIDLGDDDQRQVRYANQAGIRFTANETVPGGVSVRISPRTRGITRAILKRNVDGETGSGVLAELDVSRHRPGDWVHFDEDLEAGVEYEIVVDAGGGRNFARGRRNGVGYPITADDEVVEVTAGVYTGSGRSTDKYRYCFDRLQPGADFSDRERSFDALDDVPDDVEIIYADAELELEGDVGAELQGLVDAIDAEPGGFNHAIVLPSGTFEWNTHVQVPPGGPFFALIGEGDEGDGPHFDLRRSIDHPLTVGTRLDGVCEVIVRNIDWSIKGVDNAGHPIDTGFMKVFACDAIVIDSCRRLGKRQRWQWRDGNGPHEGYYLFGDAYGMLPAVHESYGFGIVERCHTDGGIHNTRDPDDPVAERQGNTGEGIGYSGELNEGTMVYRETTSAGSVGNTFYMRTGEAAGSNIVEAAEIYNGCRAAIRLGDGDEAWNNYLQYDDMDHRYAGSGLWFQQGDPEAHGIEIYAPDGNHELVRVSSDCRSGTISDMTLYAGAENDHFTVRCSTVGSKATEGVLIEDFSIVDESDTGDFSINISRPDVTLRNGTIDVSESPREAIGGRDEPTLEDVEIIE